VTARETVVVRDDEAELLCFPRGLGGRRRDEWYLSVRATRERDHGTERLHLSGLYGSEAAATTALRTARERAAAFARGEHVPSGDDVLSHRCGTTRVWSATRAKWLRWARERPVGAPVEVRCDHCGHSVALADLVAGGAA
jgi:hypothetical protein